MSRAEQRPRLRLPLECVPGASCWIANHVDLDPGSGTLDYACGRLTYDGHNGTDFAIRDLRAMADGVRVLAAAPGKVVAVRDGELDVSVRERGLEAVEGRQCGNGVRIAHEGGRETQYCHLRRASITVKPGSIVAAGDPIARVGLSGQTEYPHLHFVVRDGKRIVDPFAGDTRPGECGSRDSLWDSATLAALPYAPGSVFNFGVAGTLPSMETARSGTLGERVVPADAPVLAVWVEVFGVRPGDALEIALDGPDGSPIVRHRSTIEKRQARIYRAVGRKRGAAPWSRGEYQVRISLARAEGKPHSASAVNFSALVR
jgi:murein DD-endopeptidase MepM/ murein hydrolase activator NlpD